MTSTNILSSIVKTANNKDTKYWQKQLKTVNPVRNLPYDYSSNDAENSGDRKSKAARCFEEISLAISPKVERGLQTIASKKNLNIELVFLSAYYVLLYRYTHQLDLAISYLSSSNLTTGRLSITPLLFKLKDESQSFIDLLDYGEERFLSAQQHSINLKELEYLVNPQYESTSNSIPWHQILFCCDRDRQDIKELVDSQLNTRELFLKINLTSLQINLEFNADLFLPETCQRILNNYYRLLADIVEHPERQINQLQILTEAEKQAVLNQWNQTATNTETKCVHQLFETRVEQNSEAIAVKCKEQQLTYQELNQKANQVARYLQTLGVAKNSLVGLFLERSPNMVVAVLGILKTGAAYVPLDRENPSARLTYILEDSRIKVLLTESELENDLPRSKSLKSVISIDRDWDLIEQQPTHNLNVNSNPEDLAHIVYTSGSTGKPKGVMISQGNLSHYAHSLQIALNITPDDVYLHRGSIALIVSARQLLMPLAQGATVSILTTADKKDPLKMFELIKEHGVTIVDRVPSFWRNFSGILDSLNVEHRQSLMDNQIRLVAAGGEQVSLEIYQCWRKLFKSEVKLANIYGQTEGTGVVTIYYIPEQMERQFKSLPVGSPIPNMRVYVLDKELQPVPIGATGEIHISGAGVALGYLNKPELTAEKFIDNPYIEGAKLYKTGDLGRFLPNGTIQFQGRSDRQVNINGLRVELGEIETILVQHQQILEAAVVVEKNKLSETLTAYLVPSQNPPTKTEVRTFVLEKLPKYMLPNNIIFCDSFPLTASGKIDRNALVANTAENKSTNHIAPNNSIESEIVQILQDILGIKEIGIEDDFIEVGGNSLIAARLVAEIEQKYQQKIPISRVFQSSTPKALAKLVEKKENTVADESFVPIKEGNSQIILFGIHNLGHGLELYRPLGDNLDRNISLYGVSSYFSDESTVPHPRDILGLAAYYAEKIKLIQPQAPYHLMGVSFGGVIAYETAQILVAQGHQVNFLGLIDTFLPDRKSAAKLIPLKDRILGHIKKTYHKGAGHILERIKWRTTTIGQNIRYVFHNIKWIEENFVDRNSRGYAKSQYIKHKKEYKQVNRNYVMKPYPGHISLFRASDDMDPKLGWQELAQSGLSIYDVPGEHLGVLKEPNVKVLAEKLNSATIGQSK